MSIGDLKNAPFQYQKARRCSWMNTFLPFPHEHLDLADWCTSPLHSGVWTWDFVVRYFTVTWASGRL
jgi:hypothetical protein